MGKRFLFRPDHPKASKFGFVDADEIHWVDDKIESVPIVTDRHYEGICATDGTDIGSRRKRKEYMKRRNLIDADDVGPAYQERVRKEMHQEQKRELYRDIEETYRRLRNR